MASKDEHEIPQQASQRGLAGITPESAAVREQIRAGETPDAEAVERAHIESGHRLPKSFYALDPALEAQKTAGNERGLPDAHKRDEPDAKDASTKAALAAQKEGAAQLEAEAARREEIRTAAEMPAATDASGVTGTSAKNAGGPSQNKSARKR